MKKLIFSIACEVIITSLTAVIIQKIHEKVVPDYAASRYKRRR